MVPIIAAFDTCSNQNRWIRHERVHRGEWRAVETNIQGFAIELSRRTLWIIKQNITAATAVKGCFSCWPSVAGQRSGWQLPLTLARACSSLRTACAPCGFDRSELDRSATIWHARCTEHISP